MTEEHLCLWTYASPSRQSLLPVDREIHPLAVLFSPTFACFSFPFLPHPQNRTKCRWSRFSFQAKPFVAQPATPFRLNSDRHAFSPRRPSVCHVVLLFFRSLTPSHRLLQPLIPLPKNSPSRLAIQSSNCLHGMMNSQTSQTVA